MFKKLVLSNMLVILSAVILLTTIQLSYADYDSFTVNVPNGQGGYTAIVIKQSGQGYTGPQGEYYGHFPSVFQLQNVYGVNTNSNPVITTYAEPTSQEEVIVVNSAPPELPQYEQPDPPDSNYIWTPGYWSYSSDMEDYYWVPGTWVRPPTEGLLWTPGYWYWRNGEYAFSDGYWGPHIGFYGGINYGHGYAGTGASSFNGPGGANAQPTSAEQTAMHERHLPPTSTQTLQIQTASKNTELRASVNHGMPAIAATVKPGVFKGAGIVPAWKTSAVYHTKPVIAVVQPDSNRRVTPGQTEASPFHPAANRMVIPKQTKNSSSKNLPSGQSAKSVPSKPVVKKPKPKIPEKKPDQQAGSTQANSQNKVPTGQ